MNRRLRIRLLVMTILVAAIVIGASRIVADLRAETRRYRLDRALVAALKAGDGRLALSLVAQGADPNTPSADRPAPTVKRFLMRLFRPEPPQKPSPSAFEFVFHTISISLEVFGSPINELDRLAAAMIEHGAKTNSIVPGESALHFAALQSLTNTVNALLKRGVADDARDNFGWTPLHIAVSEQSIAIVSSLLAAGANPNLLTNEGENCLSISERARAYHENVTRDGGRLSESEENVIKTAKVIRRMLLARGAVEPQVRPTRVPLIARILTKQVGVNGRESLEKLFGQGAYSVGGHPNGVEDWRTTTPCATIYTEGFAYAREGELLESVEWSLDAAPNTSIPAAKRLPPKSGWLGVVYPGMTQQQVSAIVAKRLPPLHIEGDTWRWYARGYVQSNPLNADVYLIWTAALEFKGGVLQSISLQCDSSLIPPN